MDTVELMTLDLMAIAVFGLLISARLRPATTPPSPASLWHWSKTRPEQSEPFWRDYRLQALALLALTIALVISFA